MHPVRAFPVDPSPLVLLLILGAMGCAPSSPELGDDAHAQRGALGGGGAPPGSCQVENAPSLCGDRSNDACWCDELCVSYGDCCADYVVTCTSEPEGDFKVLFPSELHAGGRSTPIRIAARDPEMAKKDLVVTMSRPSAGKLVVFPTVVHSTEVDGWHYPWDNAGSMGPCKADEPDCLGPFQISVSTTDHPEQILATASTNIVAPTNVPDPSACLGGGSMAVMQMMWGFPSNTVGAASKTTIAGRFHGYTYVNRYAVDPGMPDPSLRVLSIYSDNHPIVSFHLPPDDVETGAELTGEVQFDGSCNAPGQIVFRDLTLGTPDKYGSYPVDSVTVAWKTYCAGQKTIPLEGCAHYEKGDPVVPPPF